MPHDAARYRTNYGNGQVWYAPSRERAETEARRASGSAFVEIYLPGTADEPGDWFVVSTPRNRRNDRS